MLIDATDQGAERGELMLLQNTPNTVCHQVLFVVAQHNSTGLIQKSPENLIVLQCKLLFVNHSLPESIA